MLSMVIWCCMAYAKAKGLLWTANIPPALYRRGVTGKDEEAQEADSTKITAWDTKSTRSTLVYGFRIWKLSNGRRLRILNVLDDYSRQTVGQLVSVSFSGRQVHAPWGSSLSNGENQQRLFATTEQNLPVRRCSYGARKRVLNLALSSLVNRPKIPSWKALMASSETNIWISIGLKQWTRQYKK